MHNEKQKKRVRGVVDRIENGIVVVVVQDPEDENASIEVYVPLSKFKNKNIEEGDKVTVYI